MNHVCMPLSFDVKIQRDQLSGVQCVTRESTVVKILPGIQKEDDV